MRGFGVLIAFLVLCSLCQAGIVADSFLCIFDDDPSGESHTWDYDYDTDTLILIENYNHFGTDSVNMLGEVEKGRLRFHVQKRITNSNGHDWTGYALTLGETSNDVYFDYGTMPTATLAGAGNTVFTVEINDAMEIVMSGGALEIGQTLVLDFDIYVGDTGNFDWCMTQLAIPEPATMALLGLGGLVLLHRKK